MKRHDSLGSRFKNKFSSDSTGEKHRLNSHSTNHFRSQNIEPPSSTRTVNDQKPTIVDHNDLPQTLSGKINLSISLLKKLIIIFSVGIILLLGLLVGMGGGYLCAIIKNEPIPSYTSLNNQIEKTDQSTTLYFAHNVKMEKVPTDTERKKVSFNHISPYLKKAVIATEDENFYQHKGVVPKSIIRAIGSEVTGYGTQTGGSTLTQQLVKMQLLSSETTWKRKATEILLALRLEKHFSKDQILESYLNVVPLGRNNRGQNIAGVQAAAKGLFGVDADQLSLAQSAFIAGMPQSPSVYTPFDQNGHLKSNMKLGLQRKNTVLFRMYRHGDISKNEYNQAQKVDLKTQFLPRQAAPKVKIKYGYLYNLLTDQLRNKLIHQLAKEDNIKYSEITKNKDLYSFYSQKADRLMREHDYHVHSTIDKNVYDNMQIAFAQNADQLGTTHTTTTTDSNTGATVKVQEPVQNGSVLLNNKTGAVLGFIGGQNFKENQLNHAFDTSRSPGSSIKPLLVYGPAIEQGIIGSKSMLADFKTKFGKYAPTDFDNTIGNKFVSADKALEQSLNIPAVNLYQQVLDKTDPSEYMNKLGLPLTQKEYSELGIALGGTRNGFTVLQEASAFSTFANQGVRVNPYYIDKITDVNNQIIYQHHTKKQRVYQKGTSYIMQKMMHGVINKGTASSLTYQLDFNYHNTFGKTGTSNNFRDNWFVGSTPGVTLASWMGYDNLYGDNYNLRDDSTETNQTTWANLMNSVYESNPELLDLNNSMSKPASVNSDKVLSHTGTLPGSVEYHGIESDLSHPTTTSLFYRGHAKELSKHFAIGGTDKNYKLFWDHYYGKDNSYGVTINIDDEKRAKKLRKRSSRTNISKSNLPKSDSVLGSYTPNNRTNNSSDSTNNFESNNSTNSTTIGSGSTGSGNSPNNNADQVAPPVTGGDENGGDETSNVPATGSN
ncbi:transglycosylase domain-containing protein [Bombilactobacillus thymidiniphilus]|uniref:Penicillin-binding protein n=1 Tax=Bombilactobacillus thymidiniphilus TaxID=2923363 RepID=A0ABY4PEE1_9LACO|nr:transglycosylase domain-containing protein [Bombilactobacillus thymidiniphilus]UQS83881.1 penicillin-binding protein [Bombilactobacillus thymidiniphilus]